MNILYLSTHSVLEYDELVLFTELEHVTNPGFNVEVFSMGAYSNPTQNGDYMRSVIPYGKFYPDLYGIAMQGDKDNIHPELLDWCDVVIMMHNSAIPGQVEKQRWLVRNWNLIQQKKKKCIWRSIGQSTPEIELELKIYRDQGLKIVRYSPTERHLPNYAGEDALIRFYKDPEEFSGWTGERKQVITLAQSFKKRGDHLGYNVWERVTGTLNRKVYGTENADLGVDDGGQRSYEGLKQNLKEARVFFYYGTQPAPYTLSFIEAMMTGIPIVAVGSKFRESPYYQWPNYEIPDIIQNGVNGYVGNSIEELKSYIQLLLDNQEVAERIGNAGRKTAIELFGKNKIMQEWSLFLQKLMKEDKN